MDVQQPDKHNLSSGSEADRRIATPQPLARRLLLACGIVGPALFIITFLIEGVTRPGYNSVMLTISALEAGPLGWMQVANFIIFGLFIGCFAVGLRQAFAGGSGATWVPLLEGLIALGVIGDGIFTHDPLHTACDFLAFISAVLVSFVSARRFARDPRWRGWATYSIATAILTMAFLAAFGFALSHNGPAGLLEKMATLVRSIWTILLTGRLLAGIPLSPQGTAAPQAKT